jgi:hypothetical protein
VHGQVTSAEMEVITGGAGGCGYRALHLLARRSRVESRRGTMAYVVDDARKLCMYSLHN